MAIGRRRWEARGRGGGGGGNDGVSVVGEFWGAGGREWSYFVVGLDVEFDFFAG